MGRLQGCLGLGKSPGDGSRGEVFTPSGITSLFRALLLGWFMVSHDVLDHLWWSPRQKVAELGLRHSFQGCRSGDEDAEVQSGPTAQKWWHFL